MTPAADPRSLLFLSCDLVGSTAYKQQEGTLWQKTFLSFYREFPQMLGGLTSQAKYKPGFALWKPVGDELIFTTVVRSERDIYAAVRIWLNAMRQYEQNVFHDLPLATKGGAFVATFPGPDSESSIPRDPLSEKSDKSVVELNDEALESRSNDYLYDYFGPSIDTGFRVLSSCSQRYFTLSVEVALAMSQCAADAGVRRNYELADLVLLATREFKGVWRGREYPLFALDRQHDDPVNLALATIIGTGVKPGEVVDLCKECLAKENWPSALYLPESEHSTFKKVPEDSLAPLRETTTSMEGAESLPAGDVGQESLEADPPFGEAAATAERSAEASAGSS
jgi:hypothetical protein